MLWRAEILKVVCLSYVLLAPAVCYAGWFDEIKKTAGEKLAEIAESWQGEPKPLRPLHEVQAKEHGLPSDWRAYKIQEPVYESDILVATTGKQGAPWVMLVHGLGQNGMRDWLNVVPALRQNYQVLLIDLPGFASSSIPKAKLNPTRYSQVLHYVKSQFTTEPLFVVGHSMGGAVAFRYAEHFSDDVRKLMLVDAAGILQRTAFVKHSALDRIPVDAQEAGALAGLLSGVENLGSSWVEQLARLPDPSEWLSKSDVGWGTAFGSMPNVNAALGLVEENFTVAVHNLDKDVAILWGRQDKIAPVRTGLMLAGTLPRATVRWIEDAGHVPMASHPQAFSEWLLQVLVEAPYSPAAVVPEGEKGENLGDYHCRDKAGIQLQGRYRTIVLDECSAVRLTNVVADSLVLNESVVHAENVSIVGETHIEASTLVMTVGRFTGDVTLDAGRADLAGVTLHNTARLAALTKSRVIFSVSLRGKGEVLHGDYLIENKTF